MRVIFLQLLHHHEFPQKKIKVVSKQDVRVSNPATAEGKFFNEILIFPIFHSDAYEPKLCFYHEDDEENPFLILDEIPKETTRVKQDSLDMIVGIQHIHTEEYYQKGLYREKVISILTRKIEMLTEALESTIEILEEPGSVSSSLSHSVSDAWKFFQRIFT